MKKIWTFLMLAVPTSMVIAVALFSQSDRRLREEFQPRHPNIVRVIARHCQNYVRNGVVDQAACAADPATIFFDTRAHNLRTNAGINWQADLMSKLTAPSDTGQCNYIALTNTAITPAATDTTLSGEITQNGLARAQATAYNHTSNATSYTLTKTFTCTTSAQAAQGEAVFTASSGGTMCWEDTFTQASLQVNDTLAITHTINF